MLVFNLPGVNHLELEICKMLLQLPLLEVIVLTAKMSIENFTTANMNSNRLTRVNRNDPLLDA